MAVLPNKDRFTIWAELMRLDEIFGTVSKTDLRAAVNATDDWVKANQASFNAALPAIIRTELTARQKSLLLMNVMIRKFKVL